MTFSTVLRRDSVFYSGLFVFWVLAVVMLHREHYYYGRPLPSVDLAREGGALFHQRAELDASIEELKKELDTVENPGDRMHIEHNLGIVYFNMYKGTRSRLHLDSAREYMGQSISSEPHVARFYYNYGRLFTETGDHAAAGKYYTMALSCDPGHVMALHNLGLLIYFEDRDLDRARDYLERALSVNSALPICNYVLGEIALEKNEKEKALVHFNREVYNISHMGRAGTIPTGRENLAFALAMTHLRLAGLRTTDFVDREKAQAHFQAYLRLEKDPRRRRQSLARMKRYFSALKEN